MDGGIVFTSRLSGCPYVVCPLTPVLLDVISLYIVKDFNETFHRHHHTSKQFSSVQFSV